MEESHEAQSDEEKAPPEINKKRKLKTPSQVEALENFYNEHKYPSESMKSELAEKVGLTEKQVSGWFCHRRLKDKKLSRDEALGNGRLDRSSGVIQDHGSGPGQDSCGSTKPGDYKHVDPREVESRRLVTLDFLDVDQENRGHHIGSFDDDDTSSESSSALQGNLLLHSEDPFSMKASGYPTQNGAMMPLNAKGVDNMGSLRRPSGYLKVKGKIEHAAITAVKRQLGRHYQEEGPLLGVEFDPLPPGAFEEIKDPVHEQYVGSSPILPQLPDGSGPKQHVLGTRDNLYKPKSGSRTSNLEHENLGIHGPKAQDSYSHLQFKKKPSIPSRNKFYPGQEPSKNVDEGFAGAASVGNGNRGLTVRHGTEGMRLHPAPNNLLHPYVEKMSSEQMEPYLNNYVHTNPKIVQLRDHMKTEHSDSKRRLHESDDIEERKLVRRMSQDGKLYGGRNVIRECSRPTKVKIRPQHDSILVNKRVRDNFSQPDYLRKASIGETPSWTNKKGSAADIPSSFSEDETAETSSSVD